jgi:hypothetical protein
LNSYRNIKAGAGCILAPQKFLSTREIVRLGLDRILLSGGRLGVVGSVGSGKIGVDTDYAIVEKLRKGVEKVEWTITSHFNLLA